MLNIPTLTEYTYLRDNCIIIDSVVVVIATREYFVGRYASLALLRGTKLGKMPNKETKGWFCVGWGDVDGSHSSKQNKAKQPRLL